MAGGEITLPEQTVVGAAQEAAPMPPLVRDGSDVAVMDADGSVSMVASVDLGRAITEGSRPATETEWQREKLSGIGGRIASAAVGAGQGLSFGYAAPAAIAGLNALGATDTAEGVRQGVRVAQEARPDDYLGGEIVGSLAGMALVPGGGASAAVKGEGLLARGVSRFMAAAPRAALEGAVIGAGHQMSEDALGNHEATAEKYVASIAGGAIFGGLLGGGLHAVGGAVADKARTFYGGRVKSFLSKEASEAGGVLAGDAEKVAAHPSDVLHAPAAAGPYRSPGAADKIGETYIGAAGGSKKSELGEIWRNREVALRDGSDRITGHSRDLQKAITEQQAAAKIADISTFGESKVNHMAKLVSPSRFGEQASVTKAWISEAQEVAATLSSDSLGGFGPTARKQFDEQIGRLTKALKSGDGHELFIAADNAKRWVGKQAQFGRSALGLSEAGREFDRLYQGDSGLMRVLESPAWGKAGEAQRTVNAATSESIGLGSRFKNGFLAEHGAEAGRPIHVADSSKVDAFLGRLTKSSNDLDAQSVTDMIRTRRSFLDATSSSYDHGPAAQAAFAAERKALDKMEATFAQATKETSLINQVKRMQAEEQAQKVGGLIGLATDTLGKPMTTLQRMYEAERGASAAADKLSKIAGLQRSAESVDASVSEGVKGFLSGTKGAASQQPPKVTQETVAAIREATRDPSAMTARVAQMLGGKSLDEAAPKTAQYAATAAMRIGAYLRDKAPKAPAPTGVAFVPERPRPGSASEQARFAEAVEVADSPLSVVDDLRRGRVSREKVEALKACYPQLYAQVRAEVASQAAELRPKLTQQQQVGLSVLFDVPVSAIMQPRNIDAFNKSFAQSPDPAAGPAGGQQPMQGGRGLNRKGSLASGFDRKETP